MSAITSIPSIELINPDENSYTVSFSPIRVDFAIKHPYRPYGEVIATGVPLEPVKKTASALLEYLTIDGTKITLPFSEAIDWSLVLKLIDIIVEKHCSGEIFEINTQELLQSPIMSIKLHVILKLFGLNHQADSLLKQLWEVFETHTLTPTDVFWMYGALVPPRDAKWVPELADVYLQMMAWNILNADAENRLHSDVRIFFLEEEGKPYHLTRLLQKHFDRYGLRRPECTKGVAYRKRRDTVIERTGVEATSYSSPSLASTPASVAGPIFPYKWLCSPELKEPPIPVSLEAHFEDGIRGQCKWDGVDKNVKKMAAERDGLVLLRREHIFPAYANESMMYAYGKGFGNKGWCDNEK